MPKRIQRRRTKGWRMPPNCVYVGRPTKWGNPYDWREHGRSESIRLFRQFALGGMPFEELEGKDLACWCRLEDECHADVLLGSGELMTWTLHHGDCVDALPSLDAEPAL